MLSRSTTLTQAPLDVSIIIVNWNTCDITCECLDSIYSQSSKVTKEVIVVDNASHDRSVYTIRSQYPQATLVENDENCGFAAANNQGMALATGRYYLLLNSDTQVLDGALDESVAYLDMNPEAGMMGCRVLNPDNTMQMTCFLYPGLLNMILGVFYLNKLFTGSRFFGREHMTWWQRDDCREVEVVTGCFMLARREAVDQVGVMDEAFFMFGEETDWCYRLRKKGWRILFNPTPQIIHLGGQSTRQNKPAMVLQLRAGLLQFINKHRNVVVYRIACTLVSLWFLLRLPYWVLVAPLRAHSRGACLSMSWTYLQGAVKACFGYKALTLGKEKE